MDKTDAIVMDAVPYRETTLRLTLLTADRGVVRALVKGARQPKRGVQAAFDPYAWIRATIYLKSPDALGKIGQAELVEGWGYLRHDLDRLAWAALGVEVLGAVASHSPVEAFYFREACVYLAALETARGPGSLAIALMIRLLHHAGFPPRLAEPWTPETLPSALSYDFSEGTFFETVTPGRPLRPEAARNVSDKRMGDRVEEQTDAASGRSGLPGKTFGVDAQGMAVPREAILAIMDALKTPPPLDESFTIPSTLGAPILRWLVAVWEDHLNRPLRSARFLEKMVLRPKDTLE